MKSNNVIEKIKDVLNLNEEVKLEQAKLDNGTVIEADSFEVAWKCLSLQKMKK